MEKRYTVGDDGDIYDNGKWMVEHAVDRLNALEAENARLKARCERLEEVARWMIEALESPCKEPRLRIERVAYQGNGRLSAALKDGE